MALTFVQKVEKVFEWLQSKTDTDSNKQFYEENIPRSTEVHSSEIFGQPIPTIPPMNTAGVVKKFYPVTENGDGWLALTVDRSVAGNRTWVALPTHSSNWSAGKDDVTQILKGFISPKYGKQYLVKVFNGADQEIPQLDSSDWTFDYSSGVLVFNSENRTESGNTPDDAIKIKVYQYIGKTADQMLSVGEAAGAGGRERIRAQLTGNKDGTNQTYHLPVDCDTSAHYEVQVNGVGIEPNRDFTVGATPTELTLVVALTAPETIDAIYYTKSV